MRKNTSKVLNSHTKTNKSSSCSKSLTWKQIIFTCDKADTKNLYLNIWVQISF